jgi:hypothetical protein
MATAVTTGAVTTGTDPSKRQKLDMGKGRGSKLTDLGFPIVKRKKKRS